MTAFSRSPLMRNKHEILSGETGPLVLSGPDKKLEDDLSKKVGYGFQRGGGRM
jgi:hypothetical protein